MGALHGITVATASFIALVLGMVFVHEIGHLVAAKACKIRVDSFAIGLGPRLFGFRVGETEYRLCLLPLGGYVKMTGEKAGGIEGPQPYDPHFFKAHPRWQRIIIGLAGPAANFLLAFVLMFAYYAVFNETPKVNLSTPTVDWVQPGSDAAKAGFHAGDIIRGFASVQNPGWLQLYGAAKRNLGKTVKVTVFRAGRPVELALAIPPASAGSFHIDDIGILPNLTNDPIGIGSVTPGSSAALAGIQKGDQIVSVDGLKFHFIGTLTSYMQATKGKILELGVLHSGAMRSVPVKPTIVSGAWRIGIRAAGFAIVDEPLSLGQALRKSAAYCASGSDMIAKTAKRLFTHDIPITRIAGPIAVARIAGHAAESKDWLAKFGTVSIISLNLAIFNLLPLPILDGGLVVMLLFESVRRRDIGFTTKRRMHRFAFTVLAVFLGVILLGDISKLSAFSHWH